MQGRVELDLQGNICVYFMTQGTLTRTFTTNVTISGGSDLNCILKVLAYEGSPWWKAESAPLAKRIPVIGCNCGAAGNWREARAEVGSVGRQLSMVGGCVVLKRAVGDSHTHRSSVRTLFRTLVTSA